MQRSTPAEVIGVLQGGARMLQKRDGQISNNMINLPVSCQVARYLCRQAACEGCQILSLVGLARSKQDPISRGRGTQYKLCTGPPPVGALLHIYNTNKRGALFYAEADPPALRLRLGHVVRVAGAASTQELRQDRRAPRPRMLQFFQHQHACDRVHPPFRPLTAWKTYQGSTVII